MNPPSALHGAMSRERKPFTYTPGGLDLSEIKSERMAKRLMRNAMNQGVPEIPIQQVQSPPATSNTIMVPNFNCLPVQVFPTINLPANPKSLLRTRSNPDSKDAPLQKASPPQTNQFPRQNRTDNTASLYSPKDDNDKSYQRPVSMYEYNAVSNNANNYPRSSYGNNEPSFLPEMSYEAEYFQTSPKNIINKYIVPDFKQENKSISESAEFVDIEAKQRNVDNSKNLFQASSTRNNTGFNAVIAQLECKHDNKAKANSDIIEIERKQQNDLKESFKIPNLDITVKTKIIGCDTKLQTDLSNSDKIPDLDISLKTEILKNDLLGQEVTAENTEFSPKSEIVTLDQKQNEVEECNKVQDISIDSKNASESDIQIDLDFSIQPITATSILSSFKMPVEEESRSDDEQREVKVVKKQVKKESKSEVQNGDQNGDQEAQLTVKLPTKKSAAKTETKVEVVKKQLPDGSIEEIKTTTTKTTVDGKTTISTKTETTVIPKEEEEEEEIEEEEEQEENGEVVVTEENGDDEVTEEVVVKKTPVVENGHKVVTKEEHSETTVTKKVAVVQKEETEQEEAEEEEVEEEAVEEEVKQEEESKVEVEKEKEVEEVVVEEEKVVEKVETKKVEEEVEEEEEEEEIVEETKAEEVVETKEPKKEEEEEEVEEEYEEAEEKVEEEKVEKPEPSKEAKDEESEYTEEEYESEKEEAPKPAAEEKKEEVEEQEVKAEEPKEEVNKEPEEEKVIKSEPETKPEPTVPLREPSIPLEKVEEVEIKPIGLASETVTKSHTENTEILTSNERPSGPLSTQTEYNRIENIVTVNRTTKTLDHTYEQLTQHGVPTVKAYFAPPTRDRISTSPLPARPYQPVYPPAPNVDQPQERRHSLLLERLSMERQLPSSDIYQNNYQYNNQSYEQTRQYSQEPQAEVLTVSNVKPSTITNSQWYQQQQQQQQVKKDNVIYNNVSAPVPPPAASQPWSQSQPSPQPPSQPQYQPTYKENTTQATYQQSAYQPYTPKPATWGSASDTLSSTYNTQQNQYSLNQNTTESYQKSTQQYSSSYVPPPWEQDASYVADVSSQPQNYYQPPPPASTYTPGSNLGWKATPPKSKFSKPPPTAYIPPAPNQSFVKPVNTVEPPRVPGKKTYYSEYERRYITVPESTYIPGETKYQPQPDPSPQYYYDNNEPQETVEPQWRKELREFTEKTSTQTTEQTSVKPPWEEDPKYAKPPSSNIMYSTTPTWSQTLRPRSWRERSFESEYVGSQEFSKTSTLGRGRPLSTYAKSNVDTIPERPRGVSVDRYNPNSYQAPVVAEHLPVQTHTLTVVPPAKSYHNPNVPAYHAQSRASAEPREQTIYPQARNWGDSRASPIQSRSFKYLQWITGTDE